MLQLFSALETIAVTLRFVYFRLLNVEAMA